MTLKMSDTEKRAGVGIADGPNRQPIVARMGPAEAAEAARVRPLDIGSDTGTPR